MSQLCQGRRVSTIFLYFWTRMWRSSECPLLGMTVHRTGFIRFHVRIVAGCKQCVAHLGVTSTAREGSSEASRLEAHSCWLWRRRSFNLASLQPSRNGSTFTYSRRRWSLAAWEIIVVYLTSDVEQESGQRHVVESRMYAATLARAFTWCAGNGRVIVTIASATLGDERLNDVLWNHHLKTAIWVVCSWVNV